MASLNGPGGWAGGGFRQDTDDKVEVVFKQENTEEPTVIPPSGVDPRFIQYDEEITPASSKPADDDFDLTEEELVEKAAADKLAESELTDEEKAHREKCKQDKHGAWCLDLDHKEVDASAIDLEEPKMVDQPPQKDDDKTTVVGDGEAARTPTKVVDPMSDESGHGPEDRPAAG